MYIAPEYLRVAPKNEALYIKSGQDSLHDLIRAGLKPNDDFLDLGCGSGRVAAYLTKYTKGRYVGIDIDEPRIRWCQQNIQPNHPNFSFIHLDASNSYYRTEGVELSNIKLPLNDESIDFIQMNSVFTHLKAEDCIHYLQEVKRVLRPGGTLWCSWFLLTSEAHELVANGSAHRIFSFGDGPDYYEDLKMSLIAVAYDDHFVFESIENAGLNIKYVDYGSWRGKPRSGDVISVDQDVIICTA